MKVPTPVCLGASLGVVWLVVATACQGLQSPAASTQAGFLRPQSSLAGLVRALEAVEAIRDPRGYIRIRAAECDSIIDRSNNVEYARVFLDLTIYARDASTARQVFDDLALTVESETAPSRSSEVVTRQRAAHVFQQMNWNADGLPDNCLSYSDILRLELLRVPPPPTSASASVSVASTERQPVEDYVRTIAENGLAPIGPVKTHSHITRSSRRTRDMRVEIRPESPDAHFTRRQIGAFLSELEANSTLARITRIAIQRVPHLPLWNQENGWTFEAILTLRAATP